MSEHSSLGTLTSASERFSGHYRVLARQDNISRFGVEYTRLLMGDCSGSMTAFAWPERCKVPPLPDDACIHIKARTQSFSGKVTLDLLGISTLDAPEP